MIKRISSMKVKHYKLIVLAMFLLMAGTSYSQLSGPTSAVVNSPAYFQYDDGLTHSTLMWGGGTVASHSVIDGTTYLATIYFTNPGTSTVTVKQSGVLLGSQNVSVTCPTLTAPSIIVTHNCGNSVLSYSGTPPSNVYYYWQSSTSFSTSLGANPTLTLTSPGTYYLAANTGSCWSSVANSGSAAVTININPTVTATGTQTICGATSVSGSISSNVSGTTFGWTTTPTNVNLSVTSGAGNTFGGPVSTSTASQGNVIYYITGTTPAGCTGTTSSTVYVNPQPQLTLTNNAPTICSGSATNISLGSWVSGTTFSWTATPSGVNGASSSSGSAISQTLTTTSSSSNGSASYSVAATTPSGCTGTASGSVTVYAPSAAGTLSVNQSTLCSSGTVTLSVSGKVGTLTRYMLRSQDNGGAWTSWSTTTATPSLSTSAGINRVYQFQSFAQNGNCAEVGSNIVTTTVYANSSTGTVTATPTPICSSGTVTVSASSLFTSSTQWQYRYSDNKGSTYSSWTTFSTTNSSPQTFSATSTTVDRWYQVQVIAQNGTCSAITTAGSSNIVVNTNYSGTITPGTLIEAYTSSSGSFTSSNPGTFQKWQQYSSGSWIDAGLPNTSATYNYTTLVSMQYRGIINNGACTGIYTPTVNINIYAVPTIQLVGATSPSIAVGGNSLTLQVPGTYTTYQWSKAGTDIPGATSATYQATEPSSYTVRVTSSSTSPSATTLAYNIYGIGLQPDNAMNTVVTTNIRQAGVSPSTDIYTLPTTGYSQTVQYLDMLSRPNQTVAIGQSPLQKDVVQPYSYDTLQPTSYLPYVAGTRDGSRRTTALVNGTYTNSDQYLFYQQTTTKIASSKAPYAQTLYENSPLGRVLEQGAVDSIWQIGKMHTIKPAFHTNNTAFPVRTWSPSGPTGFYASNTLATNEAFDENGNQVISYTDVMGQTILKRVKTSNTPDTTTWLDTYYVYDTRGNLAMQVPPKASNMLNSGTTWSTTFRDQWCFVYTYDVRNRIVQKQVPGAAAIYYVYDPLGRVALTQDGRLRTTNQWAFVKYDSKGRAMMSGIYTNASQTTLSTVQTLVNGLYVNPTDPYYEDRGTVLHGYTNQSFPTQNADASALQVLTVNYYDGYDFDFVGGADYAYTVQGITNEGAQGNSFGLPTGSKRLIIGTSTWLYAYQFYDRFGRPIQTRSNNHLSTTIDNLATKSYDFEGKVIQTKVYHNAGGTNQTTVLQTPQYDNQGRTLQLTHQINAGTPQVVAAYQYNELGQMVMKQLHNTGSGYLQNVDYRYNIRGWLSSINNAQLINDGNVTNGDTNDYFGMELLYNKQDKSLNNTASYNGSITAIKWKNGGVASGAADQRSFIYGYDKSDKLLTATFQANNGTAWTKEANTLNENFSYDHNGNMIGLTRNQNQRGLSGTTVTSTPLTIDNLTYTYATGNQLSKVEDSGTTAGFNNGANTTTEYNYDPTGSLTADQNKGITSIVYNVLGKAQQVTFGNGQVVNYTYDAAGIKLNMSATVSGATTSTDYVGGFVYSTSGTTSTLNFFSSPEGRVVKNTSGAFEYQYAIADHQGNTRVLFTSAAQTAQSVTAGFETANQTTEASNFSNYPTGSHINTVAANANTGSNSLYLNGGYAGQVGVAKSYKVFAGDKVSIQAYAKYNAQSGTSNLSGFATALLSAFNLAAPAAGETGTPSSAINTFGGVEAGGYGDGTTDGTDPKVFVTIVLFDKNYNFLDVSFAQLKTSGAQMSASYTVKEQGYAYLYVSNENPTLMDVYFDDVTMSYTQGNIIQGNEYYAHGFQTANSWTRDNAVANNFLANGGTELNTTTGLMDLEYRNFDPVLGRMNQVDPMADKYSSHTPYNYAFNTPVMINDPNGADPSYRNYMPQYLDDKHEPVGYANGMGYGDPEMYGDVMPSNPYRNLGGMAPVVEMNIQGWTIKADFGKLPNNSASSIAFGAGGTMAWTQSVNGVYTGWGYSIPKAYLTQLSIQKFMRNQSQTQGVPLAGNNANWLGLVLASAGVYHPSDITNAAIYAVGRIKDNPDLYDPKLSWCNAGVGLWFDMITGSNSLLGKTTFDQEAYMKGSSDFSLITDQNTLTDLANAGNLVIGVLNKADGSGHIVGVLPGGTSVCYPGDNSWGYGVPTLALDTGSGHMSYSYNVAYSWSVSDGKQVSWYLYSPGH
jgi:RHS repeat-associated protein